MEVKYRLTFKKLDCEIEFVSYFNSETEAYIELDYLKDNFSLEYGYVEKGCSMYFTDDQMNELHDISYSYVFSMKKYKPAYGFADDLYHDTAEYLNGIYHE